MLNDCWLTQDPMECCLEHDHKLLYHQYQLTGYLCPLCTWMAAKSICVQAWARGNTQLYMHLYIKRRAQDENEAQALVMQWISGVIAAKHTGFQSKSAGEWEAHLNAFWEFEDFHKRQSTHVCLSELSIAYCKYNYVQYVQSAAVWQPAVLQGSCPVMPMLTEHGLEIAGLVLRGWKQPQLERLPCTQRCDHNIIKWKKAGNNGQRARKREILFGCEW